MTKQPARWCEGGPQVPRALHEAVLEGRAEGPHAAQLARIVASIRAAGPGAATETRTGAQTTTAGAAVPAGAGALLLGALGSAALLLAAGYAAWPRDADTPGPAGPARSAQSAAPRSESPVASPAPAPATPAPLPEATRGAPTRARRADPDAELALIARARTILRSSPREALHLLDSHERRFPSGELVQERELLAIEAQLALGHRSEAARRARAFTRKFPASPYQRRIDASLQTRPALSD